MLKVLNRKYNHSLGSRNGLIRISKSLGLGIPNDTYLGVLEQRARLVRIDMVWCATIPGAGLMPKKCVVSTTMQLPSAGVSLLQTAWDLTTSPGVLRSSAVAPSGVTIISHPLVTTEASLTFEAGDALGLDAIAGAPTIEGLTVLALFLPLPSKRYKYSS